MSKKPSPSLSLYFTADLRHAIVSGIATATQAAPRTLWIVFGGGSGSCATSGKADGGKSEQVASRESVAAWLLTPSTLARLWWQMRRVDDAFVRGEYPAEKIAEVAKRFEPILRFADCWFDADECRRASAELENGGGPKFPLSPPANGLGGRWCPWDDE